MASKNTASSSSKPSSAVSNAVNDLIRAAIGGEARSIGDEDLDKYVADLILKESEAKRKKYDNVGISAYLPNTPPSNLPKPNKRFLLNMVKATDSHNQALREQEEQQRSWRQKRRRKRYDNDSDDDDQRRQKRQREHNRHMEDNRGDSDNNNPQSDDDRDTIRRQQQRRTCSPSGQDDQAPQKHIKREEGKNQSTSPAVIVRGRGAAKHGTVRSNMDKYFDERYDPLMDIEPDLNQMVYTEFPSEENEEQRYAPKEKKKKKKEKSSSKRKKSSKKRKRNDGDDDGDANDGSERHHHHHHHRRKNKRRHDSESSETSGDDVMVEEPKPIRAWDIGKQSSR